MCHFSVKSDHLLCLKIKKHPFKWNALPEILQPAF